MLDNSALAAINSDGMKSCCQCGYFLCGYLTSLILFAINQEERSELCNCVGQRQTARPSADGTITSSSGKFVQSVGLDYLFPECARRDIVDIHILCDVFRLSMKKNPPTAVFSTSK